MEKSRQAFGSAVRRLRSERGISQESFASKAGINRSYMGQIERGEVNISLDSIAKIAVALDLTLGGLMGAVDAEMESPS